MADIKLPKSLIFANDTNAFEAWKLWKQQFDFYGIATELSKKAKPVQAAIFMASIGPGCISIYNNFDLPEEHKNDMEKIEEKFTEYFTPKQNIIFERFTFNKMYQSEFEKFSDFITRITTQANKYAFKEMKDEFIRDKIVFGIRDEKLREKLLAEDQLTLQRAKNLGQSAELTGSQIKEFSLNNFDENAVNFVKREKKSARVAERNTKKMFVQRLKKFARNVIKKDIVK